MRRADYANGNGYVPTADYALLVVLVLVLVFKGGST
jgi:hypothetical protein